MWLVSLKTVFDVSRFKPALNWNRFLADFGGSNSSNSGLDFQKWVYHEVTVCWRKLKVTTVFPKQSQIILYYANQTQTSSPRTGGLYRGVYFHPNLPSLKKRYFSQEVCAVRNMFLVGREFSRLIKEKENKWFLVKN